MRCLSLFVLLTTATATVAAGEDRPFLERQVLFKAGDAHYGGYRIPSVVETANPGTVLAFAEARQALDGFGVPFPDRAVTEILMRRSVDNGRTWSKQRVVVNSADVTTGNPCAVLWHRARG